MVKTSEINILVVDDEESIRGFLEELLRGEGYGVRTAASAEEALGCLKEQVFNLVMTDIRLPGLSGMDLFGRIKTMGLPIGVIVMTSHSSPSAAMEAVRGSAYFLSKPFDDIDSVLSMVKQIADNQLLSLEIHRLQESLKKNHPAGSPGP